MRIHPLCLRCKLGLFFVSLSLAGIVSPAQAQENQPEQDITDIEDVSLTSLLDVHVSAAARYEQAAREAPASVTVVTTEEIAHYGYQTLAEALAHVRGFYLSDDLGSEYLGVRGFGRPGEFNNRILIQIDGYTINEGATGAASIGTALGLDLALVERIEVVRGPGSALYGTMALFAVINIVTKQAASLPGVALAGLAGSYGRREGRLRVGRRFQEGGVVVAGQWSDLAGHDVYFPEFDAPETNHGVAEQQDWQRYRGAMLTSTYKGLTLRGRIFSHDAGSPAAPYGRVFNHDTTQVTSNTGYLALQYEQAVSADRHLSVKGSYSRASGSWTYPQQVPQAGLLVFVDKGRSDWISGAFQYRWDISPNNRLIVGVEGKHTTVTYSRGINGMVHQIGNFNNASFSIYAQNEYRITPKLALILGLRHDRYSNAEQATAPRIAFLYNRSPFSTLKVLYGEAFRTPNFIERIGGFDQTNFIENPHLHAERVRAVEVVWQQQWTGSLFSTVSLYNYAMNHFIRLVRNPETLMLTSQNAERIRAYGAEVGVNARLGSSLRAYANYAFQHAHDGDTETRLWNSPTHLFKAGGRYMLLNPIYLAAQLRYETARRTVHGTETASFVVTDLTLTSKPLAGRLGVTMRLRNVFDATYKLPGGYGYRQHGLVQDGRTMALEVSYKF